MFAPCASYFDGYDSICSKIRALFHWSTSILLLLLLPVVAVHASVFAPPTGRVLVEIAGNIQHTNVEGTARFDYNMLESLGLVEKSIDTPWTLAGTLFDGVLTRSLLQHVGAKGQQVYAEAIDGYTITIPFNDLVGFGTLLALSMNGKRMSIRNKGPGWILYDNDDRPDVSETVLNSRMIWHLRKLTVQ